MPAPTMIEAVLFDFYATLVRSPEWFELEVRTLPEKALSDLSDRGHIRPVSSGGLKNAQRVFRESRLKAERTGRETSHVDDLKAVVAELELSGRVSRALVEETVERLHRRYVPRTTLVPGARDVLQRLRELDFRLGVISNAAYTPFIHWVLAHFDLADMFEETIVSAEVGMRKPAPGIFELALERLGVSPQAAVYVGDDLIKDVQGAKGAGLRAIWFRDDGSEVEQIEGIEPDAVVTKLLDVVEPIRAWVGEGGTVEA